MTQVMKKGLFITFEGLDGSGKTTQIKLLYDYLKERGLDVITAVEPGGTEIGRKIRKILLDKDNHEMSYKTETLLFLASRAELVSKVISPALNKGRIVICDRFFDSTVVYQGIARGLGVDEILNMSLWATGGVVPDITFLLSVKPDKGKKRMDRASKKRDRLELEKDNFRREVYKGYLSIAGKHKERFVVIDGEKNIEDISEEVKRKVENYLRNKK
jgi:dTMP kinase